MSGITQTIHVKLFRYLKWAVLVLVLAYFIQFMLGAFHKGQSRMGAAFETISHEAFRKQYDGLPQMRVIGADVGPPVCSFWNFEWIWGRCASVVFHVRDYRPEYQPIVEREVMRLAERLHKPCMLLPTLGLPNEKQLALDLECGSSKKAFRLRIHVESVTVDKEQGPPSSPHRWWVTNRVHLSSYHFKGEL